MGDFKQTLKNVGIIWPLRRASSESSGPKIFKESGLGISEVLVQSVVSMTGSLLAIAVTAELSGPERTNG